MRVRAKKNRVSRLEKVSDYSAQTDSNGFVTVACGDDSQLWVEIGCGKGSFSTELSLKNPETTVLAVELVTDVMLMAMEKAKLKNCKNLFFLCENAANTDRFLKPKSVDRIYLNFSDPWPRKRNAKRRLTSPSFLDKYKTVLKDNGKIIFKTDNRGLFDYSLCTFAEAGFKLTKVLFDLHASELDKDNIRTEYENNFSAKGFKINYLEAVLDER